MNHSSTLYGCYQPRCISNTQYYTTSLLPILLSGGKMVLVPFCHEQDRSVMSSMGYVAWFDRLDNVILWAMDDSIVVRPKCKMLFFYMSFKHFEIILYDISDEF